MNKQLGSQVCEWACSWPLPDENEHKYSRGVVGIFAGSEQYPLTGLLQVRAASRLLAGMVRLNAPNQMALLAILAQEPQVVPEPLRTVQRKKSSAGIPYVTPADGKANQGLTHAPVDAWIVGSGVSPSQTDRYQTACQLLEQCQESPVVLDAGLLNYLPELHARRTGAQPTSLPKQIRTLPWVITPHVGEANRLLASLPGAVPLSAHPQLEELQVAARFLSEYFGCTVVLKSHWTVIATSSQPTVCLTGTAWAGTAGSGDVLAGAIGSALANRFAARKRTGHPVSLSSAESSHAINVARDVHLAAACGAYWHSVAAKFAAGYEAPQALDPDHGDPNGWPITATDIAAHLPRAFACSHDL